MSENPLETSYRTFLSTLMKVLRDYSRSLRLTHGQIAENYCKLLPEAEAKRESWNAQKVGRVLRLSSSERDPLLRQEDLPNLIWAHGMAPYDAARRIERISYSNCSKERKVFKITPEDFHPNQVPYIYDHTAQFCNYHLPTESIEVYIFHFKPSENTGCRHRRPAYHEIVHCFEGEIEMSFDLGGSSQPEPYTLSCGEMLVYDASIPHTAREVKNRFASVFVISIRTR